MTWELRQKSKRTKLRLDEIIRSIRKDQRKFNYKPRIRKTKKKFVISPRIWRWTNATSVSLIPKSTSLKAVSFTKTARGKWQKWWFFRRWFSRHSEAKTKQVRRFFASCQSRRSFALQSKTKLRRHLFHFYSSERQSANTETWLKSKRFSTSRSWFLIIFQLAIRLELNEFKLKEMKVHDQSRSNTLFYDIGKYHTRLRNHFSSKKSFLKWRDWSVALQKIFFSFAAFI